MGFLDNLRKNRRQNQAADLKKAEEAAALIKEEESSHAKVSQNKRAEASVNGASLQEAPLRKHDGVTILSIINQKGGVGKTTTAVNLSAALASMGYKVLVVDLDPQGNTTSGFGVEKRELNQSIYEMLLNDIPAQDVVIKGLQENLDLIPATIDLAGAEVELVNELSRESRVKDAIGDIAENYDYVFIDCPPSLGLLTINGLVAAHSLLIPIQSEFYALEGVTKLLDSMELVKTRLNKKLDIFGVLITMYDSRTTLSKQVAKEVRDFFKEKVFETIIPRTVKLSEAPSFGEPIITYDPNGRGSKAYMNLAREVVERG